MTVSIEIIDNNVLDLLRNLEKMQLIRFLQKPTKKEVAEEMPASLQFAGVLSKETAENLHQQLKAMRDEWQ